jgi:Ca-activated chloride channel family protein
MTFIWPQMLWLLLLVPLLVVGYVLAQRRRQRHALRFASASLAGQVWGDVPRSSRHVPAVLFLLATALMLFGLARPQSEVTLPTREGTIILAIDVSGSMLADDAKPSRMDAAKSAASAFAQKQPASVRLGVVSFTDNAFIVQGPTADHGAVVAAIKRLQPQRGTSVGAGILSAMDAIFNTRLGDTAARPGATPEPTPTAVPQGEHSPAVIILLSDGESNIGPDPLDAARQAARRGVRVYTIGIGTPAGTILHIQGQSVRVRVDEATLKSVAAMTDGDYYNATDAEGLLSVYDKVGAQTVLHTEKSEVTFLFAGAAIGLALVAGSVSLLWFNRLP